MENEMYVKSMKDSTSQPTLTKSASCESLTMKVSRSFSGAMAQQSGSHLLDLDQASLHFMHFAD